MPIAVLYAVEQQAESNLLVEPAARRILRGERSTRPRPGLLTRDSVR